MYNQMYLFLKINRRFLCNVCDHIIVHSFLSKSDNDTVMSHTNEM